MSYVNGLVDNVRDDDDVDAVFWCPNGDPDGGYFVIAKPTGWFDAHPDGEGNPNMFVRVRCKAGWLRQQGFVDDVEITEERIVYRFDGVDGKQYEIPEDHVVFRSGKLYGVIERSDFKDGLAEGLGEINDGRIPEYSVSETLVEMPPGVQPSVILERTQKQVVVKRIHPPSLTGRDNLVLQKDISLVDTNDEEYDRLVDKYDTRKNAVLTVGTGKTYSTISAAITASSSGDIIEVYATAGNTYTEAITVSGKSLQIIGMVANRGLTITYSSGNQVCLLGYTTATDWVHFKNFKVVPTGSVWRAAHIGRGIYENCEFVGGTQGAVYGASSTVLVNCLARDGSGYGFANLFDAVNCVAVDCPTYGFQSGGAGYARAVLCIAAACGTAGFNSGTNYWQGMLNCADDTSAPGGGSASGFLTSDFVDYTGDDFRLKTSVKETTKARFYGYPIYSYDAFVQHRKTAGIVFAGWHDPDAVESTDPAENDVRYGVQYGNPSKTGTYALGAHDRSFSTPPVKVQDEDTTIVSGNANTRRRVRIQFHNTDSSSHPITVSHLVGSTAYEVHKETIDAGENSSAILITLEADDTVKAVSDADDKVIAHITGVEDVLA